MMGSVRVSVRESTPLEVCARRVASTIFARVREIACGQADTGLRERFPHGRGHVREVAEYLNIELKRQCLSDELG